MTSPVADHAHLLRLARCLCGERLLVESERAALQQLNAQLHQLRQQLQQLGWAGRRQLSNLRALQVARSDAPPAVACRRHVQLATAAFVPAHRRLAQHEPRYAQLLLHLRDSPQLCARLLQLAAAATAAGGGGDPVATTLDQLVDSLYAGVFGSCLLPADQLALLQLLRQLLTDQLLTSGGGVGSGGGGSSPRRQLRRGSGVFGRVYRVFVDGLAEARLFLTTALREPVLETIMNDSRCVYVSPQAAAGGDNDNDEKLAALCGRFVAHIGASVASFPPSLAWLAQCVYTTLLSAASADGQNGTAAGDKQEAAAAVVDLVFADFICPAVVDPVQYGVIEAPVSATARHNLIQVGQVLQVLALRQWRHCPSVGGGRADNSGDAPATVATDPATVATDPATVATDPADPAVFRLLDGSAVVGLLRRVLHVCERPEALFSSSPLTDACDGSATAPAAAAAAVETQQPTRNSWAVLTAGQLQQLVQLARAAVDADDSQQRLCELLAPLPTSIDVDASSCGGGGGGGNLSITAAVSSDSLLSHAGRTPPRVNGSVSRRRGLLDKMHSRVLGGRSANDHLTAVNDGERRAASVENVAAAASGPAAAAAVVGQQHDEASCRPLDVLMVCLSHDTPDIGLLTEEAVLDNDHIEADSCCYINDDATAATADAPVGDELAADVSSSSCDVDAEEATSAAAAAGRASPHGNAGSSSSSSSCPDEDNAHLTEAAAAAGGDWADVSDGRRTPNVSGRTSPVSPACSGAGGVGGGDDAVTMAGAQRDATRLAVVRGGIDDRFGKFSIVPPQRVSCAGGAAVAAASAATAVVDETTSSQASDTWSTDVLACSEADDVSASAAPTVASSATVASSHDVARLLDLCSATGGGGGGGGGGDAGSEAWSTDVVASDSERERLADVLVDIDTDSACSSLTTGTAVKLSASFSGDIGSTRHQQQVRRAVTAGGRMRRRSGESAPSLLAPQQPATATDASIVPVTAAAAAESVPDAGSGRRSSKHRRSGSSSGLISSLTERMTDERRGSGGILRTLKLFKSRRGSSGRAVRERSDSGGCTAAAAAAAVAVTATENVVGCGDAPDDILAKYRGKRPPPPDTSSQPPPLSTSAVDGADEASLKLVIDPLNVEASFAFADAKRKLRRVLSTLSVDACMPLSELSVAYCDSTDGGGDNTPDERRCALLWLLGVQLAASVQRRQHETTAQLLETLRCVRMFNDAGRRALVAQLRREHAARGGYVAYLTASRRRLLTDVERVQTALRWQRHAQALTQRALVDKCVQLFVERHESALAQFCGEFQRLAAGDEKAARVGQQLELWHAQLCGDQSGWLSESSTVASSGDYLAVDQQPSEWRQLQLLARQALEQALMTRLYAAALYPNGEADVSRDQVLCSHMRRLAGVVGPAHRDLRIPAAFHYEAPWPSAQAELAALDAYRTAEDKVACVSRCCATIMRLLQMAGGGGGGGGRKATAAADELTPVLVFVLLQARPSSLLSTIQYVDGFYGARLTGQQQYWWIQFCSAVEFIKTMDY